MGGDQGDVQRIVSISHDLTTRHMRGATARGMSDRVDETTAAVRALTGEQEQTFTNREEKFFHPQAQISALADDTRSSI